MRQAFRTGSVKTLSKSLNRALPIEKVLFWHFVCKCLSKWCGTPRVIFFLSRWKRVGFFLLQKCILCTSLGETGLSIVLQDLVLLVWAARLVLSVFTLRSLVSPIFCPTPGLFACVLGMLLSIVGYVDSTCHHRDVSKHELFCRVL
jgi:hypothetical protein